MLACYFFSPRVKVLFLSRASSPPSSSSCIRLLQPPPASAAFILSVAPPGVRPSGRGPVRRDLRLPKLGGPKSCLSVTLVGGADSPRFWGRPCCCCNQPCFKIFSSPLGEGSVSLSCLLSFLPPPPPPPASASCSRLLHPPHSFRRIHSLCRSTWGPALRPPPCLTRLPPAKLRGRKSCLSVTLVGAADSRRSRPTVLLLQPASF